MIPYHVRGYGPPGTGKTTRATAWIEYQVQQGADPAGIAFVSFTNAACDEARRRVSEKLGLYDYEVQHCATLHALCKRALRIGNEREWLAEGKLLQEFAESYDYDLGRSRKAASEDMDELQSTGGDDAVLLAIWSFGRNRLIWDADAAWCAFEEYDPWTAGRVEYARFIQFVEDYESWKRIGFLRDYTDLLRGVVENPRALPVSVVVVDEAQDMTPLLWAAADVLFAGAEALACIGDDDQAIYGYQGAAPELFNAREAARVIQLHQSWRLPRRVHELAQAVIRQNRNRVDKHFLPRAAGEGYVGRIRGLQQLDLTNGESWFILVRNWAFVPSLTKGLEESGIPYRVKAEAYYSPWSDRGPLRAVKAIYALSDGEAIPLGDLKPLLDKTRAETRSVPGAWLYGQKSKIATLMESDPGQRVRLTDLPHLGLTEWGFERIARRDLELLRNGVSDRDLTAYQAAQRRGTFGPEYPIWVSTLHGVKGQEADNVAALMSCTAAPMRALERPDRREEEIRLAYVGITRAKERFYGVEEDLGYPYEVFGL